MASVDDLSKLKIAPEQRTGRKARKFLRLFLWVFVLSSLAAALWAYPYIVPQQVEVVAVKRINPEVETSTVVLTVTGYVIPHRRVELAPKLIARVKQINVEKGDHASKGQELVLLEDNEYRANFERAQAALANAEARLAELKAGTRVEEVAHWKAQTELAEAQMRDAKQALDRVQPLVTQKVEGAEKLDKAQNEYSVAQARVQTMRTKYDMAKAGPRPEEIRAAEAAVNEAKANVAFAQTQLNDCVIKAPTNGTILERLIEVGEMVTNTSYGGSRGARVALLSMADLSDMQIEIDLNQTDLARVHLGQKCVISLEAYPDREYQGEVAQMAPEANRQKATVQVKVQILNPDERMRPELNARVSFLEEIVNKNGEKAPMRVFVPSSSIVEREGSPSVIVLDNQRARIMKIRRGAETPNGVEVIQGLAGNERVLVKPPDRLKQGAAIREKAT